LPNIKGSDDDPPSAVENEVIAKFPAWVSSIKNLNLAARARELWRYLKDDNISVMDKAVIVAALVYCISPIDLVPDHIPLAGLLDDLSIVLRVLTGIAVNSKVNDHRR
jgi:Uncharacterized conserved protein